jgi:anaerobic magnesium-protoporphyrin IX monomethyl ester cyclase
MSKIIFTRLYHSLEDEFGHLSKFGYIEISNGICWLAAVTRGKGYDTEIIDALPLKYDNDRLVEEVVKGDPKYVGVSACTIDIFAAADFAKRLKKARPDITVIIGGPHLTAAAKETMRRFGDFDIGVIGEGEITITELLDRLEDGGDLKKVNGTIFRQDGALVTTRPREFIKDLDALPLPAWELLPDMAKFYFAPAWTGHAGCTATIITSRGCPSQCIYCDRKVFGNAVRYHSAEYVLRMLKEMNSRYGIKHFRLGDDNFIINKKRLIEICEMIIDEKLKISWSCLARADSMDQGILSVMKKAGCWSVAFGVETGSQKIHDLEKKKVTLDSIEEAVKMTRAAGIRTISFNIIGHPLETEETIKQTIDFNKKIKVDEFKTQFMVPFPGTELYEYADKYGTFDKDWKNMGVFREPIFIPYGLTKEIMIKWNQKGFMDFYLQPRIILMYLLRIRCLDEVKTILLGAITLINWRIKEFFTKTRKRQSQIN